MITYEQALTANNFKSVGLYNADGTPMRCRRTGKTKTWKTRPGDFKIPVKYGLKHSFYIEWSVDKLLDSGGVGNANEWEVAPWAQIMANDKHHMVVLHLMVKADTASEAQSFAETVLLGKTQEWFNQDSYEEPPFKNGSLLMFNFMVENEKEVAP